MYLLIDDLRDIPADAIARTPETARKLLEALRSELTCVGFDHDLGTEETGYDILTWALERYILPLNVQLVTANPVGRSKMALALKNSGYSSTDGVDFHRTKHLFDNAVRRYREDGKYTSITGLREATPEYIAYLTEFLTLHRVPFLHKTHNMPHNGVLVINPRKTK
jgi:hypothetical protein